MEHNPCVLIKLCEKCNKAIHNDGWMRCGKGYLGKAFLAFCAHAFTVDWMNTIERFSNATLQTIFLCYKITIQIHYLEVDSDTDLLMSCFSSGTSLDGAHAFIEIALFEKNRFCCFVLYRPRNCFHIFVRNESAIWACGEVNKCYVTIWFWLFHFDGWRGVDIVLPKHIHRN